MNKNEFIERIKQEFPGIDDDVFKKIEIYKNFLRQENKLYNLTRLDSDEKIYFEYFYRSIIPYKNILKNDNVKLLDIGSGSGIPGILIKIFFPKIKITIIESNEKKIIFMKKLSEKLFFDDIQFWNKRAEDIKSSEYESFDFVTARAVACLRILIEISFPYLKVGGYFISPKSSNYQKELDEAKWIIKEMKINDIKVEKLEIGTFNDYLVLIKKDSKTNKDFFPRKWKDIIS